MERQASTRSGIAYVALTLLSIALGLWLRRHVLDATFLADDYDHYAMHAGIYPVARGPLDYFDFVSSRPAERAALLEAGRLPWWTHRSTHLAVLRPLASALIDLDFTLLGPSPYRLHLHSMLWWALLVAAVALLLRQLLPWPVAALSVLLYSLDESHGLPLSWIANRSALEALALCTLALWAHVIARRRSSRAGSALSLGLLALALLAGEHAVAALAYFVALEWLVLPGTLRQRARALLAVFALFAVYLCVRSLLGYGISGSGFYIDPLTSPLRYVLAAGTRLPLLFGDLLAGLGAEWHYSEPPFRPFLLRLGWVPQDLLSLANLHRAQLGAGIVATLLFGGWLVRLGRAPAAGARVERALLLGAGLSLVPMCGTLPMSRLGLGAAIGVDAALASLVVAVARVAFSRGRLASRVAAGLFVLALLAIHGAAAAVRAEGDVAYYTVRSQLEEAWVLGAELDDAEIASERVFVVAARDWTSQWALPFVRHLHHLNRPKSSELLSGSMDNPHTLTRVAPNVLQLEVIGAPWPSSFAGSVYRPEDAGFVAHQPVDAAHFQVLVEAVEQGQPTRIRFTFPRPLDSPGYVFLYPVGDGLRRLPIPEVGGRLQLPSPAVPTFVAPSSAR